MNAGVIASRYARALLMYVQESGSGNGVYSQILVIVSRLKTMDQLRSYVEDHPELSLEKRLSLLSAAAESPLDQSLKRFIRLVDSQGRMDHLTRMLISFISQYRNAQNMKTGRLVTAVPAGGVCERMEKMLCEKTEASVTVENEVDPDIIGGFIFEMDGMRLDASVSNRLRIIRKALIEKDNRIV